MHADDQLYDRDREPVVNATVVTVDTGARTAMVTVQSWDAGTHRHGPCPYIPHPDPDPLLPPIHPANGTACVVVETETERLWIASWRFST